MYRLVQMSLIDRTMKVDECSSLMRAEYIFDVKEKHFELEEIDNSMFLFIVDEYDNIIRTNREE